MSTGDGNDSGEGMETAEAYFPEHLSLAGVRRAAADCRACGLWKLGSQTVFGEGLRRSRFMLVGEMPGDREDREGRPFVGPAGRVLDRSLEEAGIARDDTYITNVVKHFKWERKGGRRLHKTPSAREVKSCLPWLEAEIELVEPHVLMLLGATAARRLLGREFRVTKQRGEFVESNLAPYVTATVHPSSILRSRTDEERREGRRRFIEELQTVERVLNGG